ncbi:type IV pilus twitching motility protein PilT [Agromyces protaetiae]|uniref:Type IV pilus twitching motility protein PilT n=1 Tax=Agromyces protaetiae TaxID=2509455 RepID=A0A4P6FGX5_9MICO|nr:type IV pilus twitching motility protein PilT [Agromyces protaetiae]QAY73127.1 type IV pilus twitching motility protein PilT [Agromyces protaetiae]
MDDRNIPWTADEELDGAKHVWPEGVEPDIDRVLPIVPEGRRAVPAVFDASGASASVVPLTPAEEAALAGADPVLVSALEQVELPKVSDLHIAVGAAPTFRVDGALQQAEVPAWDDVRVRAALMSILTPEQLERFEDELELDFSFAVSPERRFRVNYSFQRGSLAGAFRIIPAEIKGLDELGVPKQVARFAGLPRGLVLVTGPTGSGKSTTLAALIDLVNRTRADHIVTVEDPIEFLHTHKRSIVHQREVGPDTHSFATALKYVLRQDPDVILIGELRDLETISAALTAAETGHLVFATLHTQDAPQTIDRIIDVFPPHAQGQIRQQLAATLQGIVCQTLVRRATGQGRTIAAEVLIMTPAIANLIREGKTYQVTSAMQAGRELGMQTLDQSLAHLVDHGVITKRSALEKAHDPDAFEHLVRRGGDVDKSNARALGEIDFGDSFSAQMGRR